VILGGVGAGVALPQDPGQGLAGAAAAVQVGQQRVEPEATLVGPGRALLWGVGVQQRAIHVDHQQALDVRTRLPGRRSGVATGRAQAGKPVGITGDLLDHSSPWRRPHRTARAGCAARPGRKGSRRRRPAAPQDPTAPHPPHGGAGCFGCDLPASPARWSTRAGRPAPPVALPRHGRRSHRRRR
jgi:hypothetical protein